MANKAFEKQTELIIRQLGEGRTIIGKAKLLIEDVQTLTTLSIESVEKSKRSRAARTKVPQSRH